MKTIQLKDVIAKTQDYAESGSIVFGIADLAISENDTVAIDLSGVDSVPTIFMNTSFGALMDKYGADVTKSFRFRNVKQTQIERFKKYFDDYRNIILQHK